MADILIPSITHRAGCQPDTDGICDCGSGPYRCSADNKLVHVNETTMQSAYCDGQPMHRWLYVANQVGRETSYTFGGTWRQVP